MRKHTGKKPFSCNVCDSSFWNKANWTRHSRTHQREREREREMRERGERESEREREREREAIFMLPLKARVDLRTIEMKGYNSFPKAPALLEPHHQII